MNGYRTTGEFLVAQISTYVSRMEDRLRTLEETNKRLIKENHELRDYAELVERRYATKVEDDGVAMSTMLPLVQHPG